ncbi:hypothetical protein Agau_L100771 [Agrobacterium tumefaciens F2]|nr:hypothetical protein Agau_L100771 [Agrobacterium tumefaciens F2]
MTYLLCFGESSGSCCRSVRMGNELALGAGGVDVFVEEPALSCSLRGLQCGERKALTCNCKPTLARAISGRDAALQSKGWRLRRCADAIYCSGLW